MKKVKFGVIGLGHIGKRHAEMIQRNPSCELIAISDILPKQDLGLESFNVPFYNNYQNLLKSHPEIQVVCICTPNGSHSNIALDGLEFDKHLVIEKPIGLTKSKCEKVIFKALKKHKQIFAVMQNRYSPPSQWLKELIETNQLGEIFIVQVNCYWNRDDRYYKEGGWKGTQENDGGTLFTQFSHFIDIMYWLFGDIKNIEGKFYDFTHQKTTDFEDSGMINFDFVEGGMGCLNYSTAVWNTNLESSMTIVGRKGSVKVGGQYMNEIEYCNIKDYKMPELTPSNPPNDYGHYKGSAANHHYIFQNVVETLNGENVATTNVLEGLKVVEIIENIYNLRDHKNENLR